MPPARGRQQAASPRPRPPQSPAYSSVKPLQRKAANPAANPPGGKQSGSPPSGSPPNGVTPLFQDRKQSQRTAFSWRWFRRSTLVFIVSMLTVLFLIALLQGVVTQTQVRIDDLNTRIAEEEESKRVLQRQETEMNTPAQFVEVAKNKLGMVTPTTVIYLHPPLRQ